MADPLIERALVLTHVKQPGMSDFCHILNQYGVEIFSTGEIFKNLKEARVEVSPLFKFTGTPFPPDEALEILHPSIISGLSLNKDKEKQRKHINQNGIRLLDLLVCNFESPIGDIEVAKIALLGVAARNRRVTVATGEQALNSILDEMHKNGEQAIVSEAMRSSLANEALTLIAEYCLAAAKLSV